MAITGWPTWNVAVAQFGVRQIPCDQPNQGEVCGWIVADKASVQSIPFLSDDPQAIAAVN
jgi:hypothetical protein